MNGQNTNTSKAQLVPDLDMARRHLLLLDEDEEKFVFQTFDDNKERKNKSLISIFHGTLDQYAKELTRLQQQGAGVFVTVNHSSNGGRKKADIDSCRAIFREADEPNLPPLPLEPHIRIESSPGKYHEYLLLESTDDFEVWDATMQTMVAVHGSDPNAKDRSRLLRLAGFYHLKNPDRPHMVRIVEESGAHPYSLNEVAQHIPPMEMKKKKEKHTVERTGQCSKYGLAALAGELAALGKTKEGTRNTKLNNTALVLGQLVAGGELDEESVKRELLLTAMSIGLSEAEARATIKSGLDAGAKRPRTAPSNVEEWPEHPVSLDVPDLPSFTVEDFPSDLGNMVFSVSMAHETPPELAGLLGLSVVATACQRRMIIEPEHGYREPLNLWTLAALGPGNRKSAVFKVMASPLAEWELEQSQILGPAIKSAQLMRESQEARLKAMQKEFAKEKDERKRQKISTQMDEFSANLPEVPVKPQLMAQDITPERLGTLMAIHNESMGVFSAEGGFFDILAGRYSNGVPNIDLCLQAHAGDSVRVDRGSREPVWLKAPTLTMGLCVQPDVVKGLATKPSFRGRGLVGRFLPALPSSPLGRRTLESKPIPAGTEFLYKRTIRTLLEMPLPEGDIPIIKLSQEGLKAWKDFQRWVETGLDDDGEFEHMRDWAGKLPGAAARIAGLFHCFEYAGKQPQTHPVSIQTMNRALSLARKLSRHALAFYDLMGADAAIEGARKVLRWIIRNGSAFFTGHDCHYALKSTFKRRAELDPALQVLIERGYIRKVEAQRDKRPGRPPGAGTYEVHPSLLPVG